MIFSKAMSIKIPFEERDLGEEYYQENYPNEPYDIKKARREANKKQVAVWREKYQKPLVITLIAGFASMILLRLLFDPVLSVVPSEAQSVVIGFFVFLTIVGGAAAIIPSIIFAIWSYMAPNKK